MDGSCGKEVVWWEKGELAAGKHTKYVDCVRPQPWRGVQAACAGVESASDG